MLGARSPLQRFSPALSFHPRSVDAAIASPGPASTFQLDAGVRPALG
jgi:hypothetical protein